MKYSARLQQFQEAFTHLLLKPCLSLALFLALFGSIARAHDPRLTLPDPQSTAEAWNVIEESTANVDQLLDSGPLPDIAFQIANTSPCLRFLDAHANDDAETAKLLQLTKALLNTGFDVILASREKDEPLAKAKAKWADYRRILAQVEARYPKETLRAAVYICPMHPQDRHLKAGDKCSACGMALVRRHIPASSIYEKPGEPSMKVRVIAAPLVAGRPADIKIRITQSNGSPATPADLVEMHTRKIHLLINDRTLTDYHHEHPRPTDIPGEYAFSFTPNKPGPYRLWADIVPASTGIQEYAIADIPADTPPAPITDRETKLTSIVDGRTYQLTLMTAGKPIRAGETILGTISITTSEGKPFLGLEPIMGAFAHIVGFCEDQKSILHIHPLGRDPIGPTDRAGPAFTFKLYVPSPGFLRLYAQVRINGVSHFAPFGLDVLASKNDMASP